MTEGHALMAAEISSYYQRIHIQILFAIIDLMHYTQVVGSGGLVYRERPCMDSGVRSLAPNTLPSHSLLFHLHKENINNNNHYFVGFFGFVIFQAFSSGPNSKCVVNGILIVTL